MDRNLLSLIVIFCGIAVICFISAWESVKKRKIDAALRLEEMRHGYAPGTYSKYHGKKRPHEKVTKLHQEMEDAAQACQQKEMAREQMKQNIADLETRLDNLQTIMDSRNENVSQGK